MFISIKSQLLHYQGHGEDVEEGITGISSGFRIHNYLAYFQLQEEIPDLGPVSLLLCQKK